MRILTQVREAPNARISAYRVARFAILEHSHNRCAVSALLLTYRLVNRTSLTQVLPLARMTTRMARMANRETACRACKTPRKTPPRSRKTPPTIARSIPPWLRMLKFKAGYE
eukprot:302499-Prorocentrum_minimum.AAC.2